MAYLRIAALSSFLLWPVGSLVAQAVPFTAHLAQERKIAEGNGQPPKLQTVQETIMRASDGSQMQHIKVYEGGKLVEDRGVLKSKGEMYQIDYQARTVHKMAVFVPPVEKPSQPNRPGAATIHGLSCRVLPVLLEGKQVGTSWVSNQYNVEVKSDITFPSKTGPTTIHTDLTEMQPGEPDPGAMKLDPGFKVVSHPSH